jgi:hypothetical protein
MNPQSAFQLILLGVGAWMIYMMTCRTDDWLRLVKSDQERNDRIAKGLGRAAKGGIWLASRFLKK